MTSVNESLLRRFSRHKLPPAVFYCWRHTMSKTVWNRYFLGLALITSLILLVWIARVNAGAQTAISGTWTADISSKEDSKIQLSFERRDKGHRNQHGHSYEFSELQGFTREQALAR